MGFTAWKTWSSNDILTASDLNTYNRDNGKWLSRDTSTAGAPVCQARQDTLQTLSNNTSTAITFDAEDYDDMAMHDPVTNNQRLTIPTGGGGIYLCGGRVSFAAFNGNVVRDARLQDGGTDFAMTGAIYGSSSTEPMVVEVTGVRNFTAADYLTIAGRQASGGNLDTVVSTGRLKSVLWAVWIGEET